MWRLNYSRDDSLLNLLADLGLGNLLHLGEDHGRDLLGGEGLLLTEVLDLNEGGAVLVDNGEGPVLNSQCPQNLLSSFYTPSCPS